MGRATEALALLHSERLDPQRLAYLGTKAVNAVRQARRRLRSPTATPRPPRRAHRSSDDDQQQAA